MTELRLGLIGCGSIGRLHAECVTKIDGARWVACADTNETAATRAGHDFHTEYATDDPQKLIDDDTIDAIYICTRHDSHAPLAIAAANAGKHIFIEKPLALTMEACSRIREAVEAADLYLGAKEKRAANTIKWFNDALRLHLKDWLEKPLAEINRKMVNTRPGDHAIR